MKVRVIDENGTAAVIHDDLEVESEEPIATELRRFLDRTRASREGTAALNALEPSFLVDLYVETPVRKVEPVNPEGGPAVGRWERIRPRYSPPTSDVGEPTEERSVRRGDGFGPDSATRSPSPGAGE